MSSRLLRRGAFGLVAALTLAGAASPALAGGFQGDQYRGRDSGRHVDRHDRRDNDRRDCGRDYDRRDRRDYDRRCEPRYERPCPPPPRCEPPRPRSGISIRIVIGG